MILEASPRSLSGSHGASADGRSSPTPADLVVDLGEQVELGDAAHRAAPADERRHRLGQLQERQVEVVAGVVAAVQPAVVQRDPDGGPGGAGGRPGHLVDHVGVLEHAVDGDVARRLEVVLGDPRHRALPGQPEAAGRLGRLAARQGIGVRHPLAAEVDLAPGEPGRGVGHLSQGPGRPPPPSRGRTTSSMNVAGQTRTTRCRRPGRHSGSRPRGRLPWPGPGGRTRPRSRSPASVEDGDQA